VECKQEVKEECKNYGFVPTSFDETVRGGRTCELSLYRHGYVSFERTIQQ